MKDQKNPPNKPGILVVDDMPENLQILSEMLKERGYEGRPVPNGKLAIQAAHNDPPDLILMDVNMPEMDGYEVCARIKSDPRNADVPVIFISAYNETIDKLKAFSAGGVDYVTKPYQLDEVLARVEIHLKIRSLQKKLKAGNQELAESLKKQRELENLRDSLVHMMVHDLKSPLATISLCLQMIKRETGKGLPDSLSQDAQAAESSVNAMIRMVNSILDISKLEEGKLDLKREECDLGLQAREAAEVTGRFRDGARIEMNIAPGSLSAIADAEIIKRVFQNLLDNALKYSPEGGVIRVAVQTRGEDIAASIQDSGPGIAEEYHEKIFEKFWQVEARAAGIPTGSTGLGLAFCKLALEAHGGRIWVESEKGKGSTFKFVIPKNGGKTQQGI
jgi:two-component system, sensor histidine kinase and response regulator